MIGGSLKVETEGVRGIVVACVFPLTNGNEELKRKSYDR
jgi:hypothetical protein